jgi:hypothetical protein
MVFYAIVFGSIRSNLMEKVGKFVKNKDIATQI